MVKPPLNTAASKAARKLGVPRPMTKRRLENIAKFHIERFATTAANLRRVLQRRAERARRAHGGDAAEIREWVEDVVARLVKSGAVNDGLYAAGRTASLRRLGKGPGKIRALLMAKGVDRALVEAVLTETAISETGGDAALEAAFAYAKRRRIGPFGKQLDDKKAQRTQTQKDLAALGRAGFSYDIAKQVIIGDREKEPA